MADQKFVTFLRELADWYESHPTVPEPYGFEGGEIAVYPFSHDDPKEVLRSIGSFDKSFTDSYFTARKQIGGKVFPCDGLEARQGEPSTLHRMGRQERAHMGVGDCAKRRETLGSGRRECLSLQSIPLQ